MKFGLICQAVSEEKIFEIVDGRRISSPFMEAKEPVPLNRRRSYDCLDRTAYAIFVKWFPTCFCFLNLHIGVKEMISKLILRLVNVEWAQKIDPWEFHDDL